MLLNVVRELRRTGKFSRIAVEKVLFVLRTEYDFANRLKFYSFFPYQLGPFSNLSYYDMSRLQGEQCLEDDVLTENGRLEAEKLDDALVSDVRQCVSRFPDSDAMLAYVYKKYPEYAMRSKLKQESEQPVQPGYFTIGYEGRDIDAFLNVLIQNDIQILVDVRHNPFSMNFSFVQAKLKGYMEKSGIEYVHLKGLGIDGENRKNLDTDEDYAKLFQMYENEILPSHMDDFSRVVELGKEKRIALMCFEHSVDHCHRGVLARKLQQLGCEVAHL